MKYKVVRTSPFQLEFDEGDFKKLDAQVVLQPCDSEDDIIAAAQDADAVIAVLTRQKFSRRVLEKLTHCRMIVTPSIGYDGIDVAAATELGICVVNVPDYGLEEVSDHAMALLLSCARKIVALDRAVKEGKWDTVMRPQIAKMWQGIPRLRGKTLGLVGFGGIARTMAPKAQSFGIRVIAYDPFVTAGVAEGLGVKLVDLDTLLRESDFVSVHAILNEDTRHMLGLKQFRQMKKGAYLINAGRGAIVNEPELCAALREGCIAGAGLDVTDPEPPAPDNPLLQMDNVIITAHSAGSSDEAFVVLRSRPTEEVLRVLRGEFPRGLVNVKVKETYARKWQLPQEGKAQ